MKPKNVTKPVALVQGVYADEKLCMFAEDLEKSFKNLMNLRVSSVTEESRAKLPPLMITRSNPPAVDLTNAFFNLMAMSMVDVFKHNQKKYEGHSFGDLLNWEHKENKNGG